MTDSNHEARRSWVPGPQHVCFRLLRWGHRYLCPRGARHNRGDTHYDSATVRRRTHNDCGANHHRSGHHDSGTNHHRCPHYNCGNDHHRGTHHYHRGANDDRYTHHHRCLHYNCGNNHHDDSSNHNRWSPRWRCRRLRLVRLATTSPTVV